MRTGEKSDKDNTQLIIVVCYVRGGYMRWCKYDYGRRWLNECQRVTLCACLYICRTVLTEALLGELP